MNTSKKFSIAIVGGLMLATILFLFAFIQGTFQIAGASTIEGQGYSATSTDLGWATATNGARVLKLGAGMLGSVVVTGSNTATLTLWDATSTDVNKRTGNVATSSLKTYVIWPSATTNTYTFDVDLINGLIASTTSIGGGVSSSTITFR